MTYKITNSAAGAIRLGEYHENLRPLDDPTLEQLIAKGAKSMRHLHANFIAS